MTSVSAKFSGRGRALWVLALIVQACAVACSQSSDGALGSSAGTSSNGGQGDCVAGPGGARDDCAAGASAGAPLGTGGDVGSSGSADTAGAAGTADAATAGTAGTANATDGGASGASNANFVPAPHQPYPLVTDHGGPVVKNIELVSVYFEDDPLRNDLEGFNTWIVASDYWSQVGAEYGVQAGTHKSAVPFAKPASPISDVQIGSWIDARVADGSLPKPSANTVFALYYQAETRITAGASSSCTGFAGIHEVASIANSVFTGTVPFIIVPRCSFEPGDELMIATNAASHELFEAATDPFPLTNPAWLMDNGVGPLEAWQMLTGSETADLCENQFYDVIDGFTVQDMWSNSAAQAGNNPCQPSDPKHPFFSVSADMTIYHAQPGATLTINAGAWSNMPAPDWELGVNWGLVPYSDFDGQAVLSRTTVNNGDEVTATVTIPSNPPVVDGRSVYRFTIDSIDPINPNFSHPWPFLVIVP
jgi:hypothetical protein